MVELAMKFEPERRRHFKLVKYAAAGAGLGLIVSQFPRVYGQSLIVPKLASNPTLQQLLSDYSVQKEMLTVELKMTQTSPVFGEGALAFDDNNLNVILVKTLQTTGPTTDLLVNVDIDRTLSRGVMPGPNDFSVECDLQIETQQKSSALDQGTGLEWGRTEPLTFPWDIVQRESYFNPNDANYIFALQIPISYIGPGGAGGEYGFFLAWVEDGEGTFPGYPAVGDGNVPNSWGTFSMAAQQSSSGPLIAATVLAAPLFFAYWRMSRIDRKRLRLLRELPSHS